jgi:tripartite-type tricarboxylate transporter receptor subunit TctC
MGKRLLRTTALTCCLSFLFCASPVVSWSAEEKYPAGPIDVFCGFAAGGQTDLATRFLAKGLEKQLGTTFVPGNKPGGGEVIAASAIANAKPDGYTMAVLGDASLITSFLLNRATYSMEELRIVGQFYNACDILTVAADAPWKTAQEFVDYAKKNPGVKYGHPGVGSSPWIRIELFNKNGNLKMTGVPFKGDTEVITAILGKHVSIAINSYQAGKTQVDGGKMRMLFCFDPSGQFQPDLPNMRAVFGPDVPDIEPVALHLVVPSKTPENIVQILHGALEKVTKDPEFLENMRKLHLMVRFVDGKTCLQKTIPNKRAQIKAVLEHAGVDK